MEKTFAKMLDAYDGVLLGWLSGLTSVTVRDELRVTAQQLLDEDLFQEVMTAPSGGITVLPVVSSIEKQAMRLGDRCLRKFRECVLCLPNDDQVVTVQVGSTIMIN